MAHFIVKSCAGETAPATHMLNYVRVPKFDPQNNVHMELASLSKSARDAATEDKEADIPVIEWRIDELACRLWGLPKDEPKETQEFLEDLRT